MVSSEALTERELIPPDRQQRGLSSYLLYPRPEDWPKAVIAPVIFICTAWSAHGWNGWCNFILLWVVLEYLIYQARYQWNDIRGIADDVEHPERISRGRLPIGQTDQETLRNILLSKVVAVIRVIVALAVALFTATIVPVVLLTVFVFGIAVVYEAVRDMTSRRVASPLNGTFGVVGIWMIVSLGYAIRGGVGFTTGGLPILSGTAILGMLCVAAFGGMVVLLNWVLEATSHCFHDSNPSGPILPTVDGRAWFWLPTLRRKPHLAALLPYLGIYPTDGSGFTVARSNPSELTDDPDYCGLHKVLSCPVVWFAPWNIAYLFAVGFGAFLSVRMCDAYSLAYFIAAPMGLAGAVSILTSGQTLRLTILTIVVIAQFITALLTNAATPFLCPVPWLLITGMYVAYCGSSYRDLKRWGRFNQKLPVVERRQTKPFASL